MWTADDKKWPLCQYAYAGDTLPRQVWDIIRYLDFLCYYYEFKNLAQKTAYFLQWDRYVALMLFPLSFSSFHLLFRFQTENRNCSKKCISLKKNNKILRCFDSITMSHQSGKCNLSIQNSVINKCKKKYSFNNSGVNLCSHNDAGQKTVKNSAWVGWYWPLMFERGY